MLKIISVFFFSCLFQTAVGLQTQSTIEGTVKNKDGEGLPFTTLYIKNTTNGTRSNEDGVYSLNISQGKHIIVARFVGYKIQEKEILIEDGQVVKADFVLEEEVLQLKTVVISSQRVDPAIEIIKEAIKKRRYHEKEVNAYQCDVYIKGLQRLSEKPKKVLGNEITIDTGIVYLSETFSKFSFERPNKTYEHVLASKVSGSDNGFSFNRASDFMLNIYSMQTFEGLGERKFISPISPNAFLYYKYEWLGSFTENGREINKIKVIPRRTSDPVFDGDIYIEEGTWRVHSLNLTISKGRGIEFIEHLGINQVYAPASHGIWMPISQRFEFQLKVLGFSLSGYAIGIYSNYQIEPNYDVYLKESQSDTNKVDLFNKKYFGKQITKIEEEANKKDSSYWKTIRSIPLTQIEVEDYHKKDSIKLIKESEVYKDSIDSIHNRVSISDVLLNGISYTKRKKNIALHHSPLVRLFQYNTIEGLVVEIDPSYTKYKKRRKHYSIAPSLRYGFSSQRFFGKLALDYRLLNYQQTSFGLSFGSYVSQFDQEGGISPLLNSLSTLLRGQNYIKLYQKNYVAAHIKREVVNGIKASLTLEYAKRSMLQNTALNYAWVRPEKRNFTSNEPINTEIVSTQFDTHQSFILDLDMDIYFDQKYEMVGDKKINQPSKYPHLNVRIKQGIPILDANIKFSHLNIGISGNLSLGLLGRLKYKLGGGKFFSSKEMTFIDYKHFFSNQTPINPAALGNRKAGFLLMPYYLYSTAKPYIEGHLAHHFNGFLINKIPLLKKTKIQTVISSNLLHQKTTGTSFLEAGFGLEHIFKILKIDYYWLINGEAPEKNRIVFGVGF